MSFELFHYAHCPFCIRVRLMLGYLQIPYQSRVLAYDDEETPIELTSKKMLPILLQNGQAINESLDIMQVLDQNNIFKIEELRQAPTMSVLEEELAQLGNPIHSLAMPHWIYSPEFNEKSRQYFQQKKEVKRGPFSGLYQRRYEFMAEIKPMLTALETKLHPFYQADKFGFYDILLAAHLWGLYMVPEFQFSEVIHNYLQQVRLKCSFNYHQDFWS